LRVILGHYRAATAMAGSPRSADIKDGGYLLGMFPNPSAVSRGDACAVERAARFESRYRRLRYVVAVELPAGTCPRRAKAGSAPWPRPQRHVPPPGALDQSEPAQAYGAPRHAYPRQDVPRARARVQWHQRTSQCYAHRANAVSTGCLEEQVCE